jgi:hypothetical protein
MERLLKTIPCERGELFYRAAGDRRLLARCEPRIQIYEHTTQVNAIGGYGVKRIHGALVICPEPDLTRQVDEAFFQTVSGFDLSVDIQRKDGVFENFQFDDLSPEEIELGGDWTFSLNERPEMLKRLLRL